MKLKIGTRGSHLARTQSTTVANALAAQGHETELVIVRTAGDVSQAASFGSIGPQGVFVREIEQALVDGRIDAFVFDMLVLRQLAVTEFSGQIQVLPTFERYNVTMALASGSPLRESLNRGILELTRGSRWTDLLRKYIDRQE